MLSYPQHLQDTPVRADMIQNKTLEKLLLELTPDKPHAQNSQSHGEAADGEAAQGSPEQREEEEDEDEEGEEHDDGTSPHWRVRRALNAALKPDLEEAVSGIKVRFGTVPCASLDTSTNENRKKTLKLKGTPIHVQFALTTDRGSDTQFERTTAQVKRVLMLFPDLVKWRLKEELNVVINDQKHKDKGKSNGYPEDIFHEDTWKDESGAVEVFLRFKNVAKVAPDVDKAPHIILEHVGVKFDMPRDFQDHYCDEVSDASACAPSGEKHSVTPDAWKRRLLSQMIKCSPPIASDKVDRKIKQLIPAALCEMVVCSVLEGIEEKGRLLRQRLAEKGNSQLPLASGTVRDIISRAETFPPGVFPETPCATQRMPTDSATAYQYQPVLRFVERQVLPEQDAQELWKLILNEGRKKRNRDKIQEKLREKKTNILSDGNNLVRAFLNQRYRWKTTGKLGRIQHFEGTILLRAMMAGVHPQVLDALLEEGADPEVLCSQHPVGTHNAVIRSPILHWAKNLEEVQVLLENGADTESRSTMNFFTHSTALWKCCYDKNEEVLDQLLNHQADPNTRGFHPDKPPLSGNPERCTALEMAASMGMKRRAKELQDKGATFKINLAKTFRSAPAEVVQEMAIIAAKENPGALLKTNIVESTHPDVLKTVYSQVASNDCAVKKLRRAAEKMQCDGDRDLIKFLVHAIRRAPLAAGTLMDDVLLQEPHVPEPNRNPLPQTAAIQKDDRMNVAYVDKKQWDFDESAPASIKNWQKQFIYQGDPTTGTPEQSNMAEFTEVKMLNIKGVVTLEMLRAVESLPYDIQVDVFLECQSLRAIVVYAWNRWARMVHCVDVGCELVQIFALGFWWLSCYYASASLWGQDAGNVMVMICWSIFSGTVVVSFLWGLASFVSTMSSMSDEVGYNLLEHSSAFLGGAISVGLDIWLCVVGWNAWHDKPLEEYSSAMALVQFVNLITVLVEASRFHFFGEQLLPIINAFTMRAMSTMLAIIVWSWMAFAVWCVTCFSEIIPINQLMVESFLSVWVEVGGSAFFDADDFQDPVIQYAFVLGAFIMINVIMMNIFINVSGDCYTAQKERVLGSLISARLGVCTQTIAHRRFLLTWFSHKLKLDASTVLMRTGIASALVIAILLTVAVFALPSSVPVVLLLACTVIYTYIKLVVILRDTKKKSANNAGEMWWIEPNYIWICTRKPHNADDSSNGPKEPMRLFVFHPGKDGEVPIDGVYRNIGIRNGRPEFSRIPSCSEDEQKKSANIYWNEVKDQWRLIVKKRAENNTNGQKTECLFKLDGCSSPYGEGAKSWEPFKKEVTVGSETLLVMKSQEYLAFDKLYPTSSLGLRKPRPSPRGVSKRNPTPHPAIVPVEAGPCECAAPGTQGEQDGKGPEHSPQWLLDLLRRAELDNDKIDEADAEEYEAKAAEWLRRERVTESQLRTDEEACTELIEHIGLGKYPARRLRNVLRPLQLHQTAQPAQMPSPVYARPTRTEGLLRAAQMNLHEPDIEDNDGKVQSSAYVHPAGVEAGLPAARMNIHELKGEDEDGQAPSFAYLAPARVEGGTPAANQTSDWELGGEDTAGQVQPTAGASSDPMAAVPQAVQNKLRELGLEECQISSAADLKQVLRTLGIQLKDADVEEIFGPANRHAGGRLQLSELLEFLYRQEPQDLS